MKEREISEVWPAVRDGFSSLDRGEFTEYDADTIGDLADDVKVRARKMLARSP